MRKTICILSMVLTVFCMAASAESNGFYVGGGIGDAALDSDLYIYSSDNNARQPELDINESSAKNGSVYRVFAGFGLLENETKILGGDVRVVLGVQFGYTDLGSFDIDVTYNDEMVDPAEGYRYLEENAIDLTLKGAFYFANNINIFTRMGVARLKGTYTQEGLRTARQPEYYPQEQTFETSAYRPVIAFGMGWKMLRFAELYAEYCLIGGEGADNDNDRFEPSEMVENPNTLYSAGYLTAGMSLYLF